MQGLVQLKNCWLNKKDSPALRRGGVEGGGRERERENVSEYGGGGGGSSIKVCY